MYTALAAMVRRHGTYRNHDATAQESAHPHSIRLSNARVKNSRKEATNVASMFQWGTDQEHFDRVHDTTQSPAPERRRHERVAHKHGETAVAKLRGLFRITPPPVGSRNVQQQTYGTPPHHPFTPTLL